jgi:hypothetical protein
MMVLRRTQHQIQEIQRSHHSACRLEQKLELMKQVNHPQLRMLRKEKISLWEAISSPANFPNYDARTGGGYGQLQTKYHGNRQYQSSYPYKDSPESEYEETEDVDSEEHEFDLVDVAKFQNKLGSVFPTDDYAIRSTDNFYYAGAATRFDLAKLGESIGNRRKPSTMTPNPSLYKNKQAVIGGAHSWNSYQKTIQHTRGQKKGFSSSLPTADQNISDWSEEKNNENDPVSKIKRIVRAYHELNLKREHDTF